MIGLSPHEMRDDTVATNATKVIAPRGVLGIVASLENTALHQGRRRHDISADNDHRHLHRERHERPETSAHLESELPGTLSAGHTREKYNQYAQEGEDNGVREPFLAPVSESQTQPYVAAFGDLPPSCPSIVERSLCLSMFRVSHTSGTTGKRQP